MKIALVQQTIDVQRGGAETSTLEMARHLAALELDVTVVCSATCEFVADTPADRRITCRRVADRGATRAAQAAAFVEEAARFCRGAGFDVVHAITPCPAADVYQPRGGTYSETIARSVAMVRNPLLRLLRRAGRRFNRRQRGLRRIEHALLGRPDPPFVAVVSDYVRRQVLAEFPRYPADRVRVVFNGVDIAPLPPEEAGPQRAALRKSYGAEHGRLVVLLVAHNFKLKGVAELIRATATPRGRAADWLVLVAGRDESAQYEQLARKLSVGSRVRFVGSTTPVQSLYNAADVLVHPTWYDPCSRVVLEALSVGLPVVTTRWNGAAEVIEPARHGVVIPDAADPHALADAIARCADVTLARECRADAPRMRERLSMARHARELKALYEEVVAARAP